MVTQNMKSKECEIEKKENLDQVTEDLNKCVGKDAMTV